MNKAQVLEVQELAANLTIQQMADYFGFSPTTFNEIKNRQPEVSTAYKKGKSKGINYVASKLRQLIDSGDTAATIFYLKTQAGWSEQNKEEAQAEKNKGVKIIILPNARPADRIAREKAASQ